MTELEKANARIKAIADSRKPFQDLPNFEKQLIVFYLSEAFSKNPEVWRLGRSMIKHFLEKQPLTSIPFAEENKKE